jgi:Xaa-Pro dipeptidase
MISRRKLIGTSAAAAAGTAAAATLSACARAGEVAQEVAQAEEMPPSIAALGPPEETPVPISIDERRARVEKAQRLMVDNGIDGLLMCGGTSMVYFSNVRWGLSERMMALVVPARADAFVVCPAFEEERAREQLDTGPFGGDTQVYTWQEHEDPYALVGQGLRDRGIAGGKLGIEERTYFVYANGIANSVPQIEVVGAIPITAGCRGVKDDHELQLMRLASKVTLRAYKAAYEAMEEGMTQNEFADLVSMAHQRQGYSGGAGVQTGQYSALPHGSTTPQVIREGTILLIDGGCAVEGYRSDISRTFVLGEPTDKMRAVFDIELNAQTTALNTARPGVECQAVDAAARKVIEDAGYGPGYTYFTHRVGHGMGMDGHEWPYLVKGNTLPLQPGMVFSDEPGIYIRGEFGVRLEDDMMITEDGAELFTPQSTSLDDPFADVP